MLLRLSVLLLMSFGASHASAVSCQKLIKSVRAAKKLTSSNFKNSVQYLDYEGAKVPFVDLLPTAKANGKTVFLAAGFSKNMRSWMPHMNLLREQGFRVISFDQYNVGYNLRENGIKKVEKGKGLSLDADLAAAVLSKTGVSKGLTVLGHSRGAAVAARLVDKALSKGVRVEKLLLVTPYVRYIWTSTNFAASVSESFYDAFAELNPYFYGQFLQDRAHIKKYEAVENLSEATEAAALIFTLKGLKRGFSSELTTPEVVKQILEKDSRVEVQALAAEKDDQFAPPGVVKEIEQDGVDYKVVEGENKTHYWPLHYAKSMLTAVGLL